MRPGAMECIQMAEIISLHLGIGTPESLIADKLRWAISRNFSCPDSSAIESTSIWTSVESPSTAKFAEVMIGVFSPWDLKTRAKIRIMSRVSWAAVVIRI